MVAYSIGLTQSNYLLGLAYGIFDAFIVVWMRKPFSRWIRRALAYRRSSADSDRFVADLA